MDALEHVEKFKEFLEEYYEKELHTVISQGKKSLVIDFINLIQHEPELADELLENPEDSIKSAELALEQFDIPDKNLRIRFTNLPQGQYLKISDIRSEHINKFLVLEGIVRQASDVRPQVTNARFECPNCSNTMTILQLDTKFKEPSRCSCGRKGHFRLLSKDLVDAQRLLIEEAPENLEGGEQPKRLNVVLKEDLVEPKMEKKTTPGSKVKVYGIIKEIPILLKTGVQSTRFDLAMDINYIESVQEDYSTIELSEEDKEKIKEFSKDPQLFEKFTKAIAPSIYGHDKIKEAIVLQMIGGIRKKKEDGTIMRGDIHILLVGDPGSGKSQILQFVSKAAPKARYVSGKGASGVGLTAAVVKDEILKGWALEAGALVLANKGIFVVDELDKMEKEDRSALHEAMEQQTITIAKANIHATLRAETTMLAAANPKSGRFESYTPIASQIDLPPTLINRFDLIFPVRDIPDRFKDEKIASHVLEATIKPDMLKTEITTDFLRKYIAYVRQNSYPKLSQDAIDEIKNFYITLRNDGKSSDASIKSVPISARQLEALLRLSEASARLRLADEVSRADSKRAIELLKHCLMQVGFDYETQRFDIDMISTGVTANTRNKMMIVKEIINALENKHGKSIPIEDVMGEAESKGISKDAVEDIIEKLKRGGDIFEPKRGFVQKI